MMRKPTDEIVFFVTTTYTHLVWFGLVHVDYMCLYYFDLHVLPSGKRLHSY